MTVTDAEPRDGAATFELAGEVDATTFSIDGATGVLSFKAVPDHELPLDVSCGGAAGAGGNVYLVTVRATSGVDAQRKSSEQAIEVTVTDVDEDPTELPTVSGTAQVGQVLSADTAGIADPDGPGSPGWTFQWIRVADGRTETDISGARHRAPARLSPTRRTRR